MRTAMLCALLLSLGVLALSSSARADLEVVESTAPTLKVGTKLKDGDSLSVPKGGKIRLLKTPNKTTHNVVGPHEGTLADYEKQPQSVWTRALRFFSGRNAEPDDPPHGGSRGKPPQ